MGGVSDPRWPASEWYDLWHVHLPSGRDQAPGPDARRRRIQSLFAVWARVEALAGRLARPWQSWLVIDPSDPSQDAAYLHTPNPNRYNFPYPFEGVAWGVEPPGWLAEFVTGSGVDLGRSEYGGTVLYWVRRASGRTPPALVGLSSLTPIGPVRNGPASGSKA